MIRLESVAAQKAPATLNASIDKNNTRTVGHGSPATKSVVSANVKMNNCVGISVRR